jgi:hypothetical protein
MPLPPRPVRLVRLEDPDMSELQLGLAGWTQGVNGSLGLPRFEEGAVVTGGRPEVRAAPGAAALAGRPPRGAVARRGGGLGGGGRAFTSHLPDPGAEGDPRHGEPPGSLYRVWSPRKASSWITDSSPGSRLGGAAALGRPEVPTALARHQQVLGQVPRVCKAALQGGGGPVKLDKVGQLPPLQLLPGGLVELSGEQLGVGVRQDDEAVGYGAQRAAEPTGRWRLHASVGGQRGDAEPVAPGAGV